MSKIMGRVAAIVLFLLAYSPNLVAADADNDQEGTIDILGKVTNHDYFELPWTKVYLPRIYLSDGEWFFTKVQTVRLNQASLRLQKRDW